MRGRRKVLFLIHTLAGGGAEKALVNLVKALPRADWDITVKTVIDTGRYRWELPQAVRYDTMLSIPVLNKRETGDESGALLATRGGGKLALAKIYTWFWRLMPARMLYRWAVGHEDYDIVVAFLEGITTKIVSGCHDADTFTAAWVHVDLSVQKKSHALYKSLRDEHEAYQAFDRVVCVSEHVRDTFNALFDGMQEKTVVCHNILDEAEVKGLAHVEERDVWDGEGAVRIVSVGRLNWQKGYDRLLDAARILADGGLDDFKIKLIGTGTAQTDLQRQIDETGLSQKVEILGYRDNPYPYVEQADLFVAPSRTEGLSTVVAEALALGCPVLATECSGMRELLGNSGAGLIVENSTEGIASGMKELLGSSEALERCKRQALAAGNPLTADRGIREFADAVLGR